MLFQLDENELAFPPVDLALTDPNGLLAVGGDLSPERLINAYGNGIFPWFSHQEPIMWWSPDPRAILQCDKLYINRTLKKFLKHCDYQATLNQAFEQVIRLCANAPYRKQDTWITDEMIQAYINLHQLGLAHSIEVWQNQQLIGGLYGVAINSLFCGESMFYCKENSSKIALLALIKLLKQQGISFIDCQMQNPFLASMGVEEITRSQFRQQIKQLINHPLPHNFWQPRELAYT